MTIVLGDNRYGKAETHVVRVTRSGPGGERHDIKDLTVSIALSGDFAASHLSGDNSRVVPTDTQKNTVFAFAKEQPVGELEEFGLRLARHFVDGFESVHRARVSIEEVGWTRMEVGGKPHPHAFVRDGSEKRLAVITCARGGTWVVAGIGELVVLKSSGSEFWGYPKDRYTTLQETHERILATEVSARWLYGQTPEDWAQSFREVRRALLEAFATKHSLALQQTLYSMGEAALKSRPEVAEIRLSMPNRHHFAVDLSPFGLDNPNEVFYAADRPYGLIEGTVRQSEVPEAPEAW